MPKTKARPAHRDDPEQSRLFIEKAREVEADEKRSRADDLLGALGRRAPEPKKKE